LDLKIFQKACVEQDSILLYGLEDYI